MAAPWVRVIADDLTGACDVGAALLPHPAILVEPAARAREARDSGVLVVRNTQSRTLAPELAAAAVRAALADVPAGTPGVLFKKIDSALRGPLGAELDAAMDAVAAETALVLPAIPEAGRTTVDGRQLADGIPVHETAFADDPENPVRDASVVRALAATGRRRAVAVSRDRLRRVGAARVLDDARRVGASIVVGDAETDAELAEWIGGLDPSPAGPRVLVGSTGLARAWRATWPGVVGVDGSPQARPRGLRRGVVLVSGSAHPATRTQLEHLTAACGGACWPVAPSRAVQAHRAAERALAERGVIALVPDVEALGSDPELAEWLRRDRRSIVAFLADVAGSTIARLVPEAVVLVGGETAYHLLRRLGDPRLRVVSTPAPLAVSAVIEDGPLAGMKIVTKGGSSGPVDRLTRLVEEILHG